MRGLGGQTEEEAVRQALERFPSLTIESFANEPGLSSADRSRVIETMGLAGFPTCAMAAEEGDLAKRVRLPECVAGQEKQN